MPLMSTFAAASIRGFTSDAQQPLPNLPAILCWYDASRPGTIGVDASSKIFQVNDISGNDRNLFQSTSDAQPLLSRAGGKASIYFDGSTAKNLDTLNNVPLGGTTVSVHLLMTPVSMIEPNGRYLSFGLPGVADWNRSAYFNLLHNGSNATNISVQRNTIFYGANGQVAPNTLTHIALAFTGSQLRLFKNNNQFFSGSVDGTFVTTGTLRLGRGLSPGERVHFHLHEFLMSAAAFTDAHRSKIHSYFQKKWGV
jgi:hypothetical protein